MKKLDYYNTSINNIKIRSGEIIFQKQLNGVEGEDVQINDSNALTKVLIKNTLNPMTENKEERSIQTTMNTQIQRGDYIKYLDDKEEVIYIVFSRVDNHKAFKKAKMRYCNQSLMCKGQPYPIPCVADNTTYGTKGVKDNTYFEERDARLKIWVQKNKWTDKYRENMRFIFNHRICYEVTKIDDTVLDGIYVMECILDSITSLDDLDKNIAYNEDFDKDKIENIENNVDITLSSDKCKINETVTIKILPIDGELKIINDIGKLNLISPGVYNFTGIKSNDYAELQLIKNGQVLKETYIYVY